MKDETKSYTHYLLIAASILTAIIWSYYRVVVHNFNYLYEDRIPLFNNSFLMAIIILSASFLISRELEEVIVIQKWENIELEFSSLVLSIIFLVLGLLSINVFIHKRYESESGYLTGLFNSILSTTIFFASFALFFSIFVIGNQLKLIQKKEL